MFIVFAWLQRVPSLTTANDDAMYVLLSRSLREGGYHSIHLVDAPIHTKYPPLFPALLATVTTVTGESIDAFVAMNIALAVTGLALIFAVAETSLVAARCHWRSRRRRNEPFPSGNRRHGDE